MIISDDIILINENVLRDERKKDDIEHVKICIMKCCLMFIHPKKFCSNNIHLFRIENEMVSIISGQSLIECMYICGSSFLVVH